jgi:PAS domain S-box-containing protein
MALAAAIFSLLIMGALSYRWTVPSGESGHWFRNTHAVLETILDLNMAVANIESASRRFALTGKESDLRNYSPSVVRRGRDESALRSLAVDDAAEQKTHSFIETMATEGIHHADTILNFRRSKGIVAAAFAVGTVEDESLENEFQAMTSKVHGEELQLLTVSETENQPAREQTEWILLLGTVLVLLVAFIAARSLLAESARRRICELALQDTEEKLRMQVEAVQDYPIFMLDPLGQVMSWNAGAERVKGYQAEQIIGRNFSCFFPREAIAEHKPEEILRLAAATGCFKECGKRVRRDGSEFLTSVTTSAFRNHDGSLRGFSVISHDLTSVQESEARYRGLLEAAPDGMVVVNQAGAIVLLNAQAERQFGYRRDELLGQKVTDIIPKGFAERLIADTFRTAADSMAHQMSTGIELQGHRKDGSQFPVEIMLSPLEIAGDVMVTAAIRDISERKLLERQWRQSQKMEAVGQLTGGIAHDFNNLLAIVIGNLGLMESMIADNELAMKRLKPAQRAAARGADVTRRLLALASKENLNPSNLHIEDSIQETVELVGRALGPEIKILTDFDISVPALNVDATGLGSAMLNLAVNARDAMPKGGTLTISTNLINLDHSFPSIRIGEMAPGAYACISVSDTGHGMSKETLERALEPFFTTKGRNKGTGLGLAMVYGFARQSGGTVRLSSELGHGTTVSLYLPLTGTPPATSCEIPEPHFFVHTGGTVLVVDDEADLQDIAHSFLTEMGYSVLRADNAANALSYVARFKEIDLMLTDVIMPGGKNGVELAEKARRLNSKLKVVYTSGYSSDALVERNGTRIHGPMLRKPYQRSDFEAIIRRTMEGPEDPLSPREPLTETGAIR